MSDVPARGGLGDLVALLRSTAFALFFYGGSVFIVMAAFLAFPFVPSTVRPITRTWARWHHWCCRRLLGQRLVIEGDLPNAPVLYVFKHESMFETIELPRLFDRPAVMTKRELLDLPVWGRVARDYGLIPVERDAGAKALRAMLVAAKAAIAQGRPICLFAEGTRVPHGQSPPLRAGFAGLYKMLGVPVVAVALDSGRLSPRGAFIKRPGTITFRVAEAIPPGLPRDAVEAQVHKAINALNT